MMKYTTSLLFSLMLIPLFAQHSNSLSANIKPLEMRILHDYQDLGLPTNLFATIQMQPVVTLQNEQRQTGIKTDLFQAGIQLEKAGKQKNGAILTYILSSAVYALLNWGDVFPGLGNEIVLVGGYIVGGILNISGNANIKKAGRTLQL